MFRILPWVTKATIIAQGSPIGRMLSKLLTLGELSYQSSLNQIND